MEKLLLCDGHSILSRAFYGIPFLSSGSGMPTNAIYGFMNILLKAVADEEADYIAVAFDLDRKKLKRMAMYAEYKGTRKPMPEELLVQVPKAMELVRAMNIPVITLEGYEADDILGTLAKRAQKEGLSVTILTGDRDILQIADENIKISIPKTSKGRTEVFNYYPDDVKSEYGVTPLEFIDLKGLMGDTSDNIPGLPGVGEKTAMSIITAWHSIENAKEHEEEIKPPKAQKAFKEHYDLAVLSKKLAAIDINAPVEADITYGKADRIYTDAAITMLRDLDLKSLVKRFAENRTVEPEGPLTETVDMPLFELVTGKDEIRAELSELIKTKETGFSCCEVTESSEGEQLSLFDVSSKEEKKTFACAFYTGSGSVKIFEDENLKAELGGFFAGYGGTVYALRLKELLKLIPQLSECASKDMGVASYLLNPLRDSFDYDDLARDHAGITLKGRRELSVKDAAFSPEILSYEASVPFMVREEIINKLKETGMEKLYDDVEMPLLFVLDEMENEGILVDRKALSSYAGYLKGLISGLEKKIWEGAGEEFNINSPIQLGNILFEKLGLKGSKKTKRGYSTAADVLEKLAPDNEIVRDILSYRTYQKLYSTYAEGLKAYISDDGRIHGTFNQTVTATGRISSQDPNLQNIPVRTEEGREIRKVFIPRDGYIFTDADYSQVELRILASLSGDENLIDAYRNSVDIHALTASKVFHVDMEDVTPAMRRNAKAVNFGIVYGISAFGLGEDLSISRQEALSYIDSYFETYPGVKEYLDRCVNEAKKNGCVKTLYGRIRPIPELKSRNYMERQFGERVAMNSPVQGTAADIMKIAMVNTAKALKGMKSRIVLQVHDELLIETYLPEKEEVARILTDCMENAARLSVNLICEVKTGTDWNSCH